MKFVPFLLGVSSEKMATLAVKVVIVSLLWTTACGSVLAQTSGSEGSGDEAAVADPQDGQNGNAGSPVVKPPNPLEDARDRVYYPGDTENLKPLGRKLLGNVLLDQKEIWTSPFHMHWEDAKWWIAFGGLTAALVSTDHHTSTLLENSKGQVAWGNNLSTIGTSYTLVPLIAGFYSFGVLRDDPKAREVAVLGSEALMDGFIVVSVLKPIAGRERPDSQQEKGRFFDGGTSFPSGHAIESWSLASVISYEYGHTKFVPIVACSMAGIVSAARFVAQKHYASDIVAGGAMGWFIGRYVWKTHQDHAIHHHSWLKPQFVPQLEPSHRTYAVTVRFVGGSQ